MSAKKASPKLGHGPRPSSAKPSDVALRRRRARTAALAAVGLTIILAGGWWWQQHRALLPVVNLRDADPTVTASLQRRMDEVLRQPRSASAWGWLGALLGTYDFRPAACECLARAELWEPGNPRWPYYHALALLIATPNQAIPLLQKAVRICGNSPEAPRFRLAHLLAEQGRWEEARREFDALLAERPEFAPARLLAGRGALARHDWDKAMELARGCADDPRTARSALVLMATLHRLKGNAAGAAQTLQRSATLPPDEGFGDPYQAEVALLRGDPRGLSEQAHSLLATGYLTEAAAVIDRLRQTHPDYADTWLLAGRLGFLRKDAAAAERSLRRHLELSPRSVQGLFQLGLVLLARERLTEAAEVFDRATKLKSDLGPAYFNRGLALGRSGRNREAMAAFRESLRHNPERLESYLFLADLHLRAGERDSAMALLEEALAIDPNDPRLQALRERAQGPRP